MASIKALYTVMEARAAIKAPSPHHPHPAPTDGDEMLMEAD